VIIVAAIANLIVKRLPWLILAVLLVGIVSDRFDLRFTFLVSAGLLRLSLPFVRMLPKSVSRG
jgi:hypothetical protein